MRKKYKNDNQLFILINKSMTSPSDEIMEESKILKKYSQNLIYK